MAKKANGEGSISVEKTTGYVRAAITDPQGKRIVKRFKTRQEASDWLTTIRAEVLKGEYIPPSDITVGEWVSEYISTYVSIKVRPNTLMRYIQISMHLQPIADIKLQQLTATKVQKFYNEFSASDNSKLKVHKLLKAAITKACALEILSKNIMVNVETPMYRQKNIEIFTREEVSRILDSVKTSRYYSRYYPLVALAFATGARMGELLGLKLKCVHRKSITINNSLQLVAGKNVDMPPKTQAGYREITISEEMSLLLKEKALDSNILPIEGYVFHTSKGTPLTPRNWERSWKAILAEAGVEYKNFHVVRHTHATQLLANDVPILEVAKRLGHAKVTHTLTLYGHAIKGYDETIPAKVNAIFFAR